MPKMKSSDSKSFCEVKFKETLSKSKIIRHCQGRWRGISKVKYKENSTKWAKVDRFPLILSDSLCFEVRYFEIAPGGFSSLEYHNHAHVVVVLKGKGKVRLDKSYRILRQFDVLFIEPRQIHQLLNPYDEPFGFLCIVDRERDRPIEVEESE